MLFCHSRNVIHRDLKLENILLANKENKLIKVVDFGIATMRQNAAEAGTLKYLAPEILLGTNRTPSPALDIWSMGCILFALISGKLPFEGLKGEVREKIINGQYDFTQQTLKDYSPEVIDLIKKMLNTNFKNRISMAEILLHPWMKGEKLPLSLY